MWRGRSGKGAQVLCMNKPCPDTPPQNTSFEIVTPENQILGWVVWRPRCSGSPAPPEQKFEQGQEQVHVAGEGGWLRTDAVHE
jgi:hypothetical protein